MCQLRLEALTKIAPGAVAVVNKQALVDAINRAAEKFFINATPRRLRYFVAQMAFETADFTKFEENLNHTGWSLADTWPGRFGIPDGTDANGKTKYVKENDNKGRLRNRPNAKALSLVGNPQAIANNAYANRFGNGDEASGDGWRYRGRGGLHTTFKANYLAASTALYGDDRLVRNPDALSDTVTYEAVFLSAGQFWKDNSLNSLADLDQWTKLTGVINGSTVTAEARKPWLRRANENIP